MFEPGMWAGEARSDRGGTMHLPTRFRCARRRPVTARSRLRLGCTESEGSREQAVGVHPRVVVEGPGVDDNLVELQGAPQRTDALGDLVGASHDGCGTHRLHALLLSRVVHMPVGFLGGDQRLAYTALEAGAPVLTGLEEVACQRFLVGSQGPDADRGARLGQFRRRAEVAPVEVEGKLRATTLREEIGKGIRQPEVSGQLRAIVRTPQDP